METGTVWAGHRVLRLLGSGGRSRVWLADGGRVLKVLTSPIADGQPATEVEALHRARGEHVIELLDISSGDDGVVLVFPRLARGSLADLLAARPGLDAGEAVTALLPVATALARMHAAGVAHGALGAGAILFRADGAPILTGFGSAVLFEPGLPEVRREVLEAVVADRAALGGLVGGVLERVTGPRSAAARDLAQRVARGSREDFEARLVSELSELAAARPVVLDAPPSPPAAARIVPIAEPPPAEAPHRDRLPGVVLRLLESGPVEVVRREARRRWQVLPPARRRGVLGASAGALALLVLLTVLPGTEEPPGLADPAAPPQVAGPDAHEPPGGGDDPLQAAGELLERREDCMRMLSVLCLAEVDQDGSSAAVQDRAWLEDLLEAGDQPPEISATGAAIVERLGDSVLIGLAPERDPASILLIRTEAGWRIRDYLTASPGP